MGTLESPESLAREDDDKGKEDDDSDTEEDDMTGRPEVIYKLSKGKLMKLEGGTRQYENIAARASAKLGKA